MRITNSVKCVQSFDCWLPFPVLSATYANEAHFQLINATDLICGEEHYSPEGSQGMIEHPDIMQENEEHPIKELT